MSDALRMVLYVVTFPVLLFINWMIWFRLMPMMFRLSRDQYRGIRERRKSN